MIKRLSSLITVMKYKIKYRKQFVCDWHVMVDSSFSLRISGGGIVHIGRHVEIRENVTVNISNGGQVILEDGVFLNDLCCINAQEKITLKEGCQLGQGVKIYDHDHDYHQDDYKHHFKRSPVLLESGVWCGSDVIILRGSTVGSRSVLGAGLVVKGKIPPMTVSYPKQEVITKPFECLGV